MSSLRPARLAAALLATAVAAPGPVSFQYHSYDDLREWPAITAKAAALLPPGAPLLMKVDPQYVPASAGLCAPADPRGCLLLNHDPVVPSGTYYSMGDVFAYIASRAAAFSDASRPVELALCFKGTGSDNPCDDSPLASDWLSLVDELYANASALAKAVPGLALQFVLDGDAVPAHPCLANRWRPWNATYIPFQDPAPAFTSNNASLGYDRYAVLNPQVLTWGLVADAGFGKFTSSPYAWQIWEPSDQPTQVAAVATYLSSAGRHPHPPGLRFAINIDPVQFSVYTGAQSGAALNEPVLAAPQGEAAVAGRLPLVAAARDPHHAGRWLQATLYQPASGAGYAWAVHALPSLTAPLSRTLLASGAALPSPPGAPSPLPRLTSTALLPFNGSLALYATGEGGLVLEWSLACSANNCSLTAEAGSSLPGAFGSNALAAAITGCDDNSDDKSTPCTRLVSLHPGAEADCALTLSVWTYPLTGAKQQPLRSQCIASSAGLPNGGEVTQASLAAVRRPLTSDPTTSVSASAVTFVVNGATVFTATACWCEGVSGSPSPLAVNDPAGCAADAFVCPSGAAASPAPPPLQLYLGNQTTVTLAASAASSGFVVATAHSYGYCPNNEPQNKDAYTRLCDQTPRATGGKYQNYAVGSLGGLVAVLANRTTGASPCSDPSSLLFGTYDMGTNPSLVLLQGEKGEALLLEAHEGLDASDGDPNDCGIAAVVKAAPVAAGSQALLVDAWPLPPLY